MPRTPGATPLPEDEVLEPGVRYEAVGVTPAITFEVPGEGWQAYPAPPLPTPDLVGVGVNIDAPDPTQTVGVSVLRVTDVWTKHLVPDPVEPLEAQFVVPAPDDLVAWFASVPHLQLSPPTATTVGGFPATTFELVVPPLPAEAEGTCQGARCVALFSLESASGYTAEVEGATARYWVVDTGADRLVISYGDTTGVSPDLVAQAEAVVASLRFA